jgi:hypothetical protein
MGPESMGLMDLAFNTLGINNEKHF